MKNRILALITVVSISGLFFTGCILKEIYQNYQIIEELPLVEYDSNGNVVYNGNVYHEYNFNYTNFAFDFHSIHRIAKSENDWLPSYVLACGLEDFGEQIYIAVDYYSLSGKEYLKCDFHFPEYSNLKIKNIYVTSKAEEPYGKSILGSGVNNGLCLDDITTEVKFNSVDILPKLLKNININIYFADYQTIYLRHPQMYLIKDELYLCIKYLDLYNAPVSKVYRINDEYQKLFKNAIEQISD